MIGTAEPVIAPGDNRIVNGSESNVVGHEDGQFTPGADNVTVKWVSVMLFISIALVPPTASRLLATSKGRR